LAAGGTNSGFNVPQQNTLGYGNGANSTLSSLGSPSVGSLSGKIKLEFFPCLFPPGHLALKVVFSSNI